MFYYILSENRAIVVLPSTDMSNRVLHTHSGRFLFECAHTKPAVSSCPVLVARTSVECQEHVTCAQRTPALEEVLPVSRSPKDPPPSRKFQFSKPAILIRYTCELLATRVGEASRPGSAALFEASHPQPVDNTQSSSHVPSFSRGGKSGVPAGSVPAPPLFVPGTLTLRRPAPVDATQGPNSTRQASFPGRRCCPVLGCPAHLELLPRNERSL